MESLQTKQSPLKPVPVVELIEERGSESRGDLGLNGWREEISSLAIEALNSQRRREDLSLSPEKKNFVL